MAIRRCPYCKAIIDEQDKYCNNCGTQLLFPEDEYTEEEIPGDKIVEEEEEKEPDENELEETEEPEETKPIEEKEEEEEEEPEEEEEIEKPEEEEEEEEDKDEDSEELEGAEEEQKEEEEDEEKGAQFGPEAEVAAGAKEVEEELEKEEEEEEIETPTAEIKAEELGGKAVKLDGRRKKYKVSIEEDELVFKTKESDELTGTVEEGGEKLEKYLSTFQKEKARAVTPHEIPALFQEGEEPASSTKEILPPWAVEMKEEPARSAGPTKSKETEAEPATGIGTTPTRPEWTTDSGIGIPEKVTQAALPFGDTGVAAAREEKAEVVEEEGKEAAGAEIRPRAGFSLKLKSKLVDLVFITALWLITLWFTAQVIGVSFLRLIVGSLVPVLAFYFILLLLYFFLFLYFLGETLGDHYFSEED